MTVWYQYGHILYKKTTSVLFRKSVTTIQNRIFEYIEVLQFNDNK